MLPFVLALIIAARVFFQSRTDIAVEVLALRQQVAIRSGDALGRSYALWIGYSGRSCGRPGLAGRMGFSFSSRKRSSVGIGLDSGCIGVGNFGRVAADRGSPRKFASRFGRCRRENTDCGAPKIHGELRKLGFVLSERTVARYLRRIQRRGDPAKKWLSRGDYFISMGQVLLPEVEISKASPSAIKTKTRIQWTFPLAFGEIVWGDGKETFTRTFDLTETRPFGSATVEFNTDARNWQWARVAVWDVAGNGAFVNPVRR